MWRCRLFHVRQQDDGGRGIAQSKKESHLLTASWCVANLAPAATVHGNMHLMWMSMAWLQSSC